MNNCGNCIFWSHDQEDLVDHWCDNPTTVVKKCKKVQMFWDSTDWDKEGEKRIFLNSNLAFVQDGSDYYAELLTKKDFYCNMWEGE